MKYYVISFQNMKTGEIKEYYKAIYSDESIRDIAIKLVDKFNLNKEETKLHIYELKEVIYNGEY